MRQPAGPIEIRGLETTPKSTAAPACARMPPCGQRAAAPLVACESCWQHCCGGEAAHGCSYVRVRRRAPGDVRALLGCVVGNVRAARMPRVEEAQHTPALVHVRMTPRRQHKHTTDRVCACAPGKELVVRARLGIIAVETRQRTEPVYVHRLRSGSCSGVCPQARSCSHVRRRTW